MAKIFTYIIIIVGIMILFQIAGIAENSGSILGQYNINATNMSSLANIPDIDFSSIITGYISQISLGEAAALIGTFVVGLATIGLAAAIASVILVKFVSDLYSIILLSGGGWVGYVVALIMIPLIFGYIIALWEFINNRD